MSQIPGSAAEPNDPFGAGYVPIGSPRTSDERHTGAYVTSGVLLLLYGLVPIAWVVYSLVVTETPAGLFLEQLVNPLAERHVRALTHYEWAFAVVLIVVGIAALAQRRVARGGALLLSIMLLFLSIREGIGLLDSEYQDAYMASSEGGWILATRIFGLVVAVVVLAAMARATDGDWRRGTGTTGFVVAGGVLLTAGIVKLVWVIYSLAQIGALGDYLALVADPSDQSPLSMTSQQAYYDTALTVALLVAGSLAVARRPVARGASLPLAGVVLYVAAYELVGLIEQNFLPRYFTFDALLFWASVGLPILAAIVTLVVMPFARSDREVGGPQLDPAGLAPLPGHVGQQYPGRD